MAQTHYNLPSLKMLSTFECAARQGSFKAAAAELNVTTSAISHQIKALEQHLGLRLFERGHRHVQLTPDGQELNAALGASFAALSSVVERLRIKHASPQLTIGATTAVSTLWLTPRVARFWRESGDITISQHVRDRPFIRPIQADLIIEYALKAPNEEAIRLFGDTLTPLCNPEFADQYPHELADLAQAPLIHMDAAETSWTNWPNWFEILGYEGPLKIGQRVNNYTIALQLAQDGVGIVLGWKRLVQPLLEVGKLVTFSPHQIQAPGAFYLTFKKGARDRPEIKSFSNWLINNLE